MQRKFLNRKQKVKFLSDVSKGKTNLKEIIAPKYDVWFVTDGIYENEVTGEVISKDKFQERFKDVDIITFK